MIYKKSRIIISGSTGGTGDILFKLFKKNSYNVEKLDLNDLSEKDVFIHLAARNSSPNEIINSNINYLNECIEYCRKVNIKYFIFFSSMSIYGNLNQQNVDEQTKINSTPNIYGLTKLLGEELLKNEEFKLLILRLPAILTKNCEKTFIYKIYKSLQNNENISITNFDQLFNNIVDVHSIFNFIINYDFSLKNDIYILANHQEYTLTQIIEFMKKKLKSNSDIIYNENKTNFYNINIEKSLKKCNYINNNILDSLNDWIELLEGKNEISCIK